MCTVYRLVRIITRIIKFRVSFLFFFSFRLFERFKKYFCTVLLSVFFFAIERHGQMVSPLWHGDEKSSRSCENQSVFYYQIRQRKEKQQVEQILTSSFAGMRNHNCRPYKTITNLSIFLFVIAFAMEDSGYVLMETRKATLVYRGRYFRSVAAHPLELLRTERKRIMVTRLMTERR